MDLVFVIAPQTIETVFEQFLASKRGRRPRTIEWYTKSARYYRQIVEPRFGAAWPPTVDHLDYFLRTLVENGISETTQDIYFRGLRVFFNWAEKRHFLTQNPINLIDPPRPAKLLPKAPTEATIVKLFATLYSVAGDSWHNRRDLAILCLALDSGIRIGEMVRLQLTDVDLVHQQILVLGDTKDHEERVLMISDNCAEQLSLWIAWRFRIAPSDIQTLFVGQRRAEGRRIAPLTESGIRQRLRIWLDRAELPRFKFHALRHAYAIYSLRNHADLLDVQRQLGHSSIQTTAVYLKVADEGRNERHQKSSPLKKLTLDSKVKN